jgi:hypothetical protein
MKTTSISVVSINTFFICACGSGEPPPPCHGACVDSVSISTEKQSKPASVLNLASPGDTPLDMPWDARDKTLLRIAKQTAPGTDIALGAIIETSIPCAGGGTQTDIRDNVDPPWYSQGDSSTTVYTACVTGNTQTDGQKSYTVDVLTGQPYIDATWSTGTTIARDLTRINLTTGEVAFAIGSMSEQLSVVNNVQYTQVFSGSSNRNWLNNGIEQIGTEQYQVNYAWDETTQIFQWDFDVSSTNTAFGDSAAVTLQTLAGTLGTPPDSGQFRSTKSQFGTTTVSTITATGGGNVLIETDSDGDGIIDTTTTSTWNQLLLDPILNQFI